MYNTSIIFKDILIYNKIKLNQIKLFIKYYILYK